MGSRLSVKDSRTADLQMGQSWKRAPQLSHTQAWRQGSSTTLTAALRHTTQSLGPSEPPSSSSSPALAAAATSSLTCPCWGLGALPEDEADCPPSADMKRDCRTQRGERIGSLGKPGEAPQA